MKRAESRAIKDSVDRPGGSGLHRALQRARSALRIEKGKGKGGYRASRARAAAAEQGDYAIANAVARFSVGKSAQGGQKQTIRLSLATSKGGRRRPKRVEQETDLKHSA